MWIEFETVTSAQIENYNTTLAKQAPDQKSQVPPIKGTPLLAWLGQGGVVSAAPLSADLPQFSVIHGDLPDQSLGILKNRQVIVIAAYAEIRNTLMKIQSMQFEAQFGSPKPLQPAQAASENSASEGQKGKTDAAPATSTSPSPAQKQKEAKAAETKTAGQAGKDGGGKQEPKSDAEERRRDQGVTKAEGDKVPTRMIPWK